jgi:hypothetical protein
MLKAKIVALVVVSLFLSAINGCPSNPAPVEKTGQTVCYSESGTPRDCAGTGEDGEYQKGAAWPNPRFTDNNDGTITDNLTGLIWLQNANCFGLVNVQDALSRSNELGDGSCGLTDGSNAGDWRLPNRFELESLLNLHYYGLAVPDTAGTGQWTEGDPFNNVQSDVYWSSTTHAFRTDSNWAVYMVDGSVDFNNKYSSVYAWPVRGGE